MEPLCLAEEHPLTSLRSSVLRNTVGIPELSLFFAKHLWFCQELHTGKTARHFTLLVHRKVRGDWRADVGRERNSEKMLGDKWPQTASPSNFVKGHGSTDTCMSLKITPSPLKFSPVFYIWVSFVSPALPYFPIHSLLLPWQGEKEEESECWVIPRESAGGDGSYRYFGKWSLEGPCFSCQSHLEIEKLLVTAHSVPRPYISYSCHRYWWNLPLVRS